MLKKTITYKDFNGTTRTEDFYFNLTKSELVKLQHSEAAGFTETVEGIVAENDSKRIMELFEDLIRMSYGERSEDGRNFLKSKEISDKFIGSAAYDELFIELLTKEGANVEFVTGIVPDKEELEAVRKKFEARENGSTAQTLQTAVVPQVSSQNLDVSKMSVDDLMRLAEERRNQS